MSGARADHPDVVVFPPVILLAVLVLAVALQWLLPLGVMVRVDRTWRIAGGGVLMLLGVAVTLAGARTLRGRGTNINPAQPVLALATDGIYRWTRNPMYVGGTPAMIGIAIVFALDWLPLLMVPAALLLHFGVVRREEQHLEREFGEDYRRYQAQVPRYLGIAASDPRED